MGDVTVNKHCGNCQYFLLCTIDGERNLSEGYCSNLDRRRDHNDRCTDWEPMEINPDKQEVKE